MGHFTINLPENRLGDVRFGTVKTKNFNFNLFSKSKPRDEPKTGYIIRVAPGKTNQEEYRLFKSKDGRWSTDVHGEKELDSYIYMYIKYFITEKESGGR